MNIGDLIVELEIMQQKHGDIEVTMQGTCLKDGYSRTEDKIFPDVFESTVETLRLYDDNSELGKRIRLFWQT